MLLLLGAVGQNIKEVRDANRQDYRDQLLGLLDSVALDFSVYREELYEDGKRATSLQLSMQFLGLIASGDSSSSISKS